MEDQHISQRRLIRLRNYYLMDDTHILFLSHDEVISQYTRATKQTFLLFEDFLWNLRLKVYFISFFIDDK